MAATLKSYRIVPEALTDATRHPGPQEMDVYVHGGGRAALMSRELFLSPNSGKGTQLRAKVLFFGLGAKT